MPNEQITPLQHLAAYAAQIQRKPRRKGGAADNLLGLAFDEALIAFEDFYLRQKAAPEDTKAAIARQVYKALNRRKEYVGGEDIEGRYRRFAEAAFNLFKFHSPHGDLPSKIKRYLRAAYITYFLETPAPDQETKITEHNAEASEMRNPV